MPDRKLLYITPFESHIILVETLIHRIQKYIWKPPNKALEENKIVNNHAA